MKTRSLVLLQGFEVHCNCVLLGVALLLGPKEDRHFVGVPYFRGKPKWMPLIGWRICRCFLGGGAKHMPALERWNLRYLVRKAGFGPKYQLGYAEFVRDIGESPKFPATQQFCSAIFCRRF